MTQKDYRSLVARIRWFGEDALADEIEALAAERDALRAQLEDVEAGKGILRERLSHSQLSAVEAAAPGFLDRDVEVN